MNIHHHDDATALHLTQAILLYETQDANRNGDRAVHATHHDVAWEDGSRPTILEGRAITQEALLSLLARLRKPTACGVLPANVLAVGETYMVWWTPPQHRLAFFRGRAGDMRGTVAYPTLIYAVVQDQLYVFAAAGKDRPDAATPLYHAPLMNVWAEGRVCVGNVDLPRQCTTENLAQWEAALLDSFFTHPNHDKTIIGYQGGLSKFYAAMMKKKKATDFPEKHLSPMNRTLGDLIHSFHNPKK